MSEHEFHGNQYVGPTGAATPPIKESKRTRWRKKHLKSQTAERASDGSQRPRRQGTSKKAKRYAASRNYRWAQAANVDRFGAQHPVDFRTLKFAHETPDSVPRIAVDLDRTILEHAPHPHFGKPREGALLALLQLRAQGNILIVHTSRPRKEKQNIEAVLDFYGIPYDYVRCGKLHADVYIDDKALDARNPWSQVAGLAQQRVLSLGEALGHEFHGNQWSKEKIKSEEVKAWVGDRKDIAMIAVRFGTNPLSLRDANGTLKAVASWAPRHENLEVEALATVEPGHGRAAMQKLCSIAAKHNKGVTLSSADDACGFYEKLGMEEFGTLQRYKFTPEQCKQFAQHGKLILSHEPDDDNEPEDGVFVRLNKQAEDLELGNTGDGDTEIDGHWITIGGSHIFIKDGVDFHQQVQDHFKKKYNNLSSWVSKNKAHPALPAKKAELEAHKNDKKLYQKNPHQFAAPKPVSIEEALAPDLESDEPDDAKDLEKYPGWQEDMEAFTESEEKTWPIKATEDGEQHAEIHELDEIKLHFGFGGGAKTEDQLKAEDPHAPGNVWASADKNFTRYGNIVVNPDNGKILLREPSNHYQGFHWTFARGGIEPGEHPLDAAKEEAKEELGFETEVSKALPGTFKGASAKWSSCYYVSKVKEGTYQVPTDHETSATKWCTYEEAKAHIMQTENVPGRERDLKVLDAVYGKAPSKVYTSPIPAIVPSTPVAVPSAPVSSSSLVTVGGQKVVVKPGQAEAQAVQDHFKKAIANNSSWLSKNKSKSETDTLVVLKKAQLAKLKSDYHEYKSGKPQSAFKAPGVASPAPSITSPSIPSSDPGAGQPGHMAWLKAQEDAQKAASKFGEAKSTFMKVANAQIEQAKALFHHDGHLYGSEALYKASIAVDIGAKMKAAGVTETEVKAFLNDHSGSSFVQFAQEEMEGKKDYHNIAVAALVQNWAQTSNGKNTVAHAIQKVAEQELGVENPSDSIKTIYTKNGNTAEIPAKRAEVKAFITKHGKVLRAFVNAQYANTQEKFAKAGITELTLQRGITCKVKGPNVQMCALNSFSYSHGAAKSFSRKSGTIMECKVPVKDIFGSHATGFGCTGEEEIVVIGGIKEIKVVPK